LQDILIVFDNDQCKIASFTSLTRSMTLLCEKNVRINILEKNVRELIIIAIHRHLKLQDLHFDLIVE